MNATICWRFQWKNVWIKALIEQLFSSQYAKLNLPNRDLITDEDKGTNHYKS